MSTTITGVNTVAITLSPTTPDVLVAGTISATESFATYVIHYGTATGSDTFGGALYAPAGTGFSIQNDSVIETSTSIGSTFYTGILLGSPGTVANFGEIAGEFGVTMLRGNGGYIKNANIIIASDAGVFMDGAGRIVNTGTIIVTSGGSNIAVEMVGSGYILNTGTISGNVIGLNLGPGETSSSSSGDVTFINSGTIFGAALAKIGTMENAGYMKGLYAFYGVVINTGTDRVTNGNALEIEHTGQLYNYGFVSASGTGAVGSGYVYNSGIVIGGVGVGIGGASVSNYVYNSGTIIGTSGAGVSFQGYAQMINTGTVRGGTAGIVLNGGGYTENYGVLTGATGIYSISRITASVYNYGTIIANAGAGVSLAYGVIYNTALLRGKTSGAQLGYQGYIYNSGQITASGTGSSGILLNRSGSVVNAGHIAGKSFGISVGGAGDIYNAGTVTGASGIAIADGFGASQIYNYGLVKATGAGGVGIALAGGTALINDGLIEAASGTGVILGGGGELKNNGTIIGGDVGVSLSQSGTVYDAGTITGSKYAVELQKGYHQQLIITPSAVLNGTVYGAASILELARGNKTGTVGTNFISFSAVCVDKKAKWNFAGHQTLSRVSNYGVIEVQTGETTDIGYLSGDTGTVDLAGGTLALGASDLYTTISFQNPGETLYLAGTANIGATLSRFTLGDALDVTGLAITNVSSLDFAGGALTISEISTAMTIYFGAHTTFQGETFVAFADGAGTGISLQSTAAMNFLTPALAAAAPAPPEFLPLYMQADRPAPAAAPSVTASQRGWLSQDLLTTFQPSAAAVTLHS